MPFGQNGGQLFTAADHGAVAQDRRFPDTAGGRGANASALDFVSQTADGGANDLLLAFEAAQVRRQFEDAGSPLAVFRLEVLLKPLDFRSGGFDGGPLAPRLALSGGDIPPGRQFFRFEQLKSLRF